MKCIDCVRDIHEWEGTREHPEKEGVICGRCLYEGYGLSFKEYDKKYSPFEAEPPKGEEKP